MTRGTTLLGSLLVVAGLAGCGGAGAATSASPVGLDGRPGSGLGRRAGAGLDRRARRVSPQPDHDPAVHCGGTGDQPAAGPVE